MRNFWIPILHSHLPFVKHPKYEYFLEERWLFEAIDECYIPLLKTLKRLHNERVEFYLTTSITPPLAEMLQDTLLMQKYERHLDKMIKLGEKELKRVQNQSEDEQRVARFYKDRYESIREFFYGFLDKDILSGYRYFASLGKLEIITSCATHGFLPILSLEKKSVEIQIEVAIKSHIKNFNKAPDGIWLPECAYFDGLDKILEKYGIKYFFSDSHTLTYAKPTAKYGTFAPVYTPNHVALFARDVMSAKKVWSSKEGYPGDFNYRDFYRDIGYDLEFEYIKDFISPDGKREFTGFKYHKITGKGEYKEFYDPFKAKEMTKIHAKDFVSDRIEQFKSVSSEIKSPIVVSAYDAELFGHWWFEGSWFLYHLFKEINKQDSFKTTTPMRYLKKDQTYQVLTPTPSSWGDGGYYRVWLNKENDWIYRHLHNMADSMQKLANRYKETKDPIKERILNQLLRELLLAQSSDWAFLITMKSAKEYSIRRTKEHIYNFLELSKMLKSEVDIEFLKLLEQKNSIFSWIDFRVCVYNHEG